MLNRKLKIIDDLIRGKTGPVRVMDRLSQAIPKQVWLTDWTEKGGSVTVAGEALTNKHVGAFMSSLSEPVKQKTDQELAAPAEGKKKKDKGGQKIYFTDIRLVETTAKEAAEFQLVYVSFTLTLRVNYAI